MANLLVTVVIIHFDVPLVRFLCDNFWMLLYTQHTCTQDCLSILHVSLIFYGAIPLVEIMYKQLGNVIFHYYFLCFYFLFANYLSHPRFIYLFLPYLITHTVCIDTAFFWFFRGSLLFGGAKATDVDILLLKRMKWNPQHRMQFIFREIMSVSDVSFRARPGECATGTKWQSSRTIEGTRGRDEEKRMIDRELNFLHTASRGSK